MFKYTLTFLVTIMALGNIAEAKNTDLIFPIACTYGKDCWAVNYMDVDPTQGVQDFQCNQKSYNGHKGTDFALGSITHMNKGVDVLAAADGTILRLRDGENDHLKSESKLNKIAENKKECGNGVLIDHGQDLHIFYCHLKKGSISVKPKQKVKAGEKIAQVGQSGMAEFPHLHMGITHKGKLIDPYTGLSTEDGCGEIKAPLWHEALNITYEPVVIFDGGFTSQAPDFEQIKRDGIKPIRIPLNSAAFIFWVGFYNIEEGDIVTMEIKDPNGMIFSERTLTAEKTRARQYYFTGRKIGKVQLVSGTYSAHVRLTRSKNNNIISRDKNFTIEVRP